MFRQVASPTDMYPYKTEVFGSPSVTERIADWLADNCRGEYMCGCLRMRAGFTTARTYWFETKEDLVLFKMFWLDDMGTIDD